MAKTAAALRVSDLQTMIREGRISELAARKLCEIYGVNMFEPEDGALISPANLQVLVSQGKLDPLAADLICSLFGIIHPIDGHEQFQPLPQTTVELARGVAYPEAPIDPRD